MIDQEIIERKLLIIEDNLALLTRLASLVDDKFDCDFRNMYTAIHLLQMCVEAMLDCVNHAILILGLARPAMDARHYCSWANKG